ncbi:MAG TPA: CBS domain-containing protein [Steroidobacteraceae bacterium]|nr:CBS domain-containing protein [Steroidobacteraceae bacterium]
MLVRDLCTSEVVCCHPQTTALEAARLMRHKHVGDVVVVDDPLERRVPLGIVTDRDLVVEILGDDRDAATTVLSTLVDRPVVIARDTEDASVVIERMRTHGVRRVPVVDERESLVGIVTLDDLLKTLLAEMHALLETQGRAQRHEQSTRR